MTEGAGISPELLVEKHPREPNLERRGLEHIEGYKIELLQSTGLSVEQKQELHQLSTALFSPDLIPPPINQWGNPTYSLGRVMPQDYSSEHGNRSNTALVFVPGIGVDAAGVIPAAVKLQEAYQKQHGADGQAITFTLDAPAHPGDWPDILKTHMLQRTAYQAQMLFEQICEHDIKNVAFFVHSLGATEVMETALLLQELLKKNKPDTIIDGIVFAQAPGLFEKDSSIASGVKTYGKEFADALTLRHGIRYLFPSPEDIFEMKRRQEEAIEAGKMDDARFYGKIIDAQNLRRGKIGLPAVATPTKEATVEETGQQAETDSVETPYILPKYKHAVRRIPDESVDQVPALDQETFSTLVEIDNALELAHTAGQKAALLGQRSALLKPITKKWRQDTKWYANDPPEPKEEETGGIDFSNVTNVLNRLVKGIPDYIRQKVDIPVGYAYSMAPEDTYFRAEEAHDKIALEHLQRMEQLHLEQQLKMQQLEKKQMAGKLLPIEETRKDELQKTMTPAYRQDTTRLFPNSPRVVAATWGDLPHASATYQFKSLGQRCIDMLDRLRSTDTDVKNVRIRDIK